MATDAPGTTSDTGTRPAATPPRARRGRHTDTPRLALLMPGCVFLVGGTALALVAHRLVPQVGTLTWAVALGAAAANLGALPAVVAPGLHLATRRLLRVGVALLGFSLPLAAIAGLGIGVISLVVTTLVVTLLATFWLGLRLGVGRPRSLLIGAGFAICGASAIAAMEEPADADADDVATAIAMVTLCGTVVMVALPFLQGPLSLSKEQFGVWAGASVHEVGQVVAAASPVGAAAVGIAVVVKLTRVLLLAPVVAAASASRRRTDTGAGGRGRRPPLLPLFVAGFLGCVAIRSAGLLPTNALPPIEAAQTAALAAALFGMGTGVRVRALLSSSSAPLVLSTLSTLLVAAISLAGVLLLV